MDGLGRLVQSYVQTYTAIKKIAQSRPSERDFHKVPWGANTRVLANGLQSIMKNLVAPENVSHVVRVLLRPSHVIIY